MATPDTLTSDNNMNEEQEFKLPVLIVDDDEGFRKLLSKNLKKLHYETLEAATGKHAIDAIRHNPNILAILDQRLPDMTGTEIVTAILQYNLKTPFIIMTGQGDERLAVEMMKLGAKDYLIKDTDLLDRLPGVIKRVFSSLETEIRLYEAKQEQAKLQAQLLQSQKLESIGRLAGGVAHDFNNMLGAILGYSELAIEKVDPSDSIYNFLKQIQKAAERSAGLTRQLLAFARKQTVNPEIVDLNQAVKNMLSILHRLIGEDIQLSFCQFPKPVKIKIDPSQLDQILINLCVNARDAIEEFGNIQIKVSSHHCTDSCPAHADSQPDMAYATLEVTDDGMGISEEVMPQLFEPFFTTKQLGHGTGLGLSTIYGIIRQNQGFIDVKSQPGTGTTFAVFLPMHSESDDEIASNATTLSNPGGNELILLVEDELTVIKMAEMMLSHLGYQVITATTPEQAIRLAEEYSERIHLLMTDVIMPQMSGRTLAEKLTQRYDKLKVLYMSGYTAEVISQDEILEAGAQFIQKPFNMGDLAAKIRAALDSESTRPLRQSAYPD